MFSKKNLQQNSVLNSALCPAQFSSNLVNFGNSDLLRVPTQNESDNEAIPIVDAISDNEESEAGNSSSELSLCSRIENHTCLGDDDDDDDDDSNESSNILSFSQGTALHFQHSDEESELAYENSDDGGSTSDNDDGGSTSEEGETERRCYDSDASDADLSDDDDDDGHFSCPYCFTILLDDHECNNSDCDGPNDEYQENIFTPDSRTRDLIWSQTGYDDDDFYAEEASRDAAARINERKKRGKKETEYIQTIFQGTHSYTISSFNTWRLGKKEYEIKRETRRIAETIKGSSLILLLEVQSYKSDEYNRFIGELEIPQTSNIIVSDEPTSKSLNATQKDHFVAINRRLEPLIHYYIHDKLSKNPYFDYVPHLFEYSLVRNSINVVIKVIVVHFSVSSKRRVKEVIEISKYIRNNDSHDVWIIAGDFNTEDLPEINKHQQEFERLIRSHSVITVNSNGEPTNSPMAKNPKPYDGAYICFPINAPYEISISNFKVTQFDALSKDSNWVYRSKYSDHAPISFKLTINSELIAYE